MFSCEKTLKKRLARARCAGLSFLSIERKETPNHSSPPPRNEYSGALTLSKFFFCESLSTESLDHGNRPIICHPLNENKQLCISSHSGIVQDAIAFFRSHLHRARSVAASYKPPMLVTRVRLPACAYCPLGARRSCWGHF